MMRLEHVLDQSADTPVKLSCKSSVGDVVEVRPFIPVWWPSTLPGLLLEKKARTIFDAPK